jgi:F-type H+-transporting ATPase subunit b
VTLFGKQYGDLGQFVLKLTNFLIFAALLFLMLKGSLSRAFSAKASEIETKLAQSKRDSWEAESQLRDLDSKMSGLEGELAGILEKAEADAETERQRILDTARAEAEQIMVLARAEIERQRRTAEAELRELVSRLALEGAEGRIIDRKSVV